jgi:DNA repair exonuclease SbcCD nuclease subunit
MAAELIPPNLHLILEPEGRTIAFPELATQLWGRALVEHSPGYRPLMGVPEPVSGQWNIALAHGFFAEDGDTNRSSPILPSEIAASAYHYIALGHVHVFSDVSQGGTRAFYCGTPAPLYASSEAGWVAHVNCVPNQPVTIDRVRVSEEVLPSLRLSAPQDSP